MDLVVDANVIISALVSLSGKTSGLLFSDNFNLYAPEFLLEEIKKHGEEIKSKSGLLQGNIELALTLISLNIKFIPFSEFEQFISESSEICPDPNDIEYFALALKIKCSIWSNDKKIGNQDLVKVLTTSELLKMF